MNKIILYIAVACAVTSCGNNQGNQAALIQATKTEDSLKAAIAEKNTIDSMSALSASQKGANEEHRSYEHHGNGANNATTDNNSSNNGQGGAPPPPPPPPVTNVQANPPAPAAVNPPPPAQTVAAGNTAAPAPPAKKGMSAKAEGALIGAGAGAVTGALLDSKKKGQAVKGGVIGGVIGAAAGLGAGALIDHKNKRNQDSTAK